MAEEAGVDLVEVAAKANPPVCRLMDYGKFRYQEQKRRSRCVIAVAKWLIKIWARMCFLVSVRIWRKSLKWSNSRSLKGAK